jgi:uncharacterized protein YndB with AHSA1/START domain
MTGLVATADIDIDASRDRVWQALTDPRKIEKYMFGSHVESEWKPGSPIVWKGEYEGKQFVDSGQILAADPGELLQVTHSSSQGGPEHIVTYRLSERGGHTHLTLSQDNNGSLDEVQHSTENWKTMLNGLKKVVEAERR